MDVVAVTYRTSRGPWELRSNFVISMMLLKPVKPRPYSTDPSNSRLRLSLY